MVSLHSAPGLKPKLLLGAYSAPVLVAVLCEPFSTAAPTPATEFKASSPKMFRTMPRIIGRSHASCASGPTL